jgi:hypothetical protein
MSERAPVQMPPRTYIEWGIRRPGQSEAMNTHWVERDAKEALAAYLDHGEPVELVRRTVTVRMSRETSPFEIVTPAPEVPS